VKALILHYGVGNVFSIENAFKKLGFETEIKNEITEREDIDCLILPGVGSFTAAVENVSKYRKELLSLIKTGIPTLGICLGMQILFQRSEEGPGDGLGIFKGSVVSLPDNVKKPHMGWNILRKRIESPLLEGVDNAWVYFNHTYHPNPLDEDTVVAKTSYGVDFPSVVGIGSIFGTQFHPEKSSKTGQKILENFRKIVRR